MSAAPKSMEPKADPLACVKPWIKAMPIGGAPLSAVDVARDGGLEGRHLLHLNECPYPPSEKVVAAIIAAATTVNRYPEPRGMALARRLAERYGVSVEQLAFGTGSDELLHFACALCLGPGDSAVMPTPSFPRYRVSTALVGAEPILVKLDPRGANDVSAQVAALKPNTKILFACTPNNPSGAFLSQEELDRLIADTPDDVLLAMDEAYYEFGKVDGAPDVLAALAKRRGPWMVFRTFSKAYALAGMRVGYCIASTPELAANMRKLSTTFNVTNLAFDAAIAALDSPDYTSAILANCTRERGRIADGLKALGYDPMPTSGNFISFDCGRKVDPIIEAMRARGVLIREWRDPGYETHLRISIGDAKSTDAVLLCLTEVLGPRA
jgi:histidinol-phosphate aminotransferase